MRNASICEGPCRSQLPGALARAMPARGGKNEIGTDAPTKSRLARIRPRHNKEIEQLRVTESGAGRCTLTQRLGFDLKGGLPTFCQAFHATASKDEGVGREQRFEAS